VPYCYSPTIPKPLHESEEVHAYCNVPVYAQYQEVRANRVDAHIINHKTNHIITLEMSSPRIANRETKSDEKTLKYRPLRWELQRQYLGYKV